MRHLWIMSILVFGVFCTIAAAQETPLRQLSTFDDGKGWKAVGRLDLGRRGFCTATLVGDDLVLTAAHCMYDKSTGQPFDLDDLQFLAGFRNGNADAYRGIRRVVIHPRYRYGDTDRVSRVAYDLALLQLDRPIRMPGILPLPVTSRAHQGDEVGVVSYAQDRADAPSLQEICHVLAGRPGVLMLSCDVNFGSSGAPVFTTRNGRPEIVSVVSSKADLQDQRVALSTAIDSSLDFLKGRLTAGEGVIDNQARAIRRFGYDDRPANGSKFIKP